MNENIKKEFDKFYKKICKSDPDIAMAVLEEWKSYVPTKKIVYVVKWNNYALVQSETFDKLDSNDDNDWSSARHAFESLKNSIGIDNLKLESVDSDGNIKLIDSYRLRSYDESL